MSAYRHRQQHRLHTLRYGPRHFYRHHVTKEKHPHLGRGALARQRKARLLLLAGGLAVLVVVGVLLGLSAYNSALRAKQSLEAARSVIAADISNKHLFLSVAGRAKLASDIKVVETKAEDASAVLHGSIGMRILSYVPLVSDQPNGVVSLVADVRTTALVGSTLLQRVNALEEQSNGTTVSINALQSLQRSVASARTTMAQLDRPVGDLIGPIASARRALDTQIAKISTDLVRGDQTLSYALPFLGADGPRSYLIAGENNAEMRDQGDVLSLALMHAQNGTFDVSTIGPVDNIEPSHAVDVAMPATTNLVFGGFLPTALWQSVNASANFPLSARIMQAMFAQVQGTHVNGVIAMDVPALGSLLRLTGPVAVPGIAGPVTAQNVATVILHDQYAAFPAASAQALRKENIAAVASAVVQAMKVKHIDLAALGNALATAVAGRHLMVWDEVPNYQSTIAAIGASGAIDSVAPTRTFHVALENLTATKLDYYVHSSVDVQVHVSRDGDASINTTVTVVNDTPAGSKPSYQTGPDRINSFTSGQYVGRVLLWSPRGSIAPRSTSESGLELSETQTSVLPQQSQSVSFATVIRHAVANRQLRLRYIPQPRLVPSAFQLRVFAPGLRVVGPSSYAAPLSATKEFSWGIKQ